MSVKNWKQLQTFSVEKFLSAGDYKRESDAKAILKFVNRSIKINQVSFKDQQDKQTFLGDFEAALIFARKLSEVPIEGVEPLENVLDYYGGLMTKEELMKIQYAEYMKQIQKSQFAKADESDADAEDHSSEEGEDELLSGPVTEQNKH